MPPEATVRYMNALVERALGDARANDFGDPLAYLKPIIDHLDTANRHMDAGVRLPEGTRLGRFKKLFLRLARLHTTEQAAFNRATVAALHVLNHNIAAAHGDAHVRLTRAREALEATDALIRALAAQCDRLHERIVHLEIKASELGREADAARTDAAIQRTRLEVIMQEARRRIGEAFDDAQLAKVAGDVDDWLAPLYSQLEDVFRGSREDIKGRQRVYLPDMSDLPGRAPVVDIGCGRGEWLELLAENGIPAYGVDTNKTFVDRNVERGLDVRYGDAIDHLLTVEPGSIGAVTAFHVVEHLPFEDLVRLVDAALVAIRPGGILLFETPNPTNLLVGASSFYIDPTHRSPVHPLYLEFLIGARGFTEVEVRYLHPATDPGFPLPSDPEGHALLQRLNDAFFGPQDYAAIGRKVDRHS
ncbi:MAG TPA: methyltransferase domain-containing protein [Acidimicrobiales bacterium]|nr:methyltransferase domain-containing protein [Acidimicrobiales bacterium]